MMGSLGYLLSSISQFIDDKYINKRWEDGSSEGGGEGRDEVMD